MVPKISLSMPASSELESLNPKTTITPRTMEIAPTSKSVFPFLDAPFSEES